MTAAASHAGRETPAVNCVHLETSAPRIAVGADRMVQPLSLPSGALLRPTPPTLDLTGWRTSEVLWHRRGNASVAPHRPENRGAA
jgi:hypothetical protein